jgi:hypothetical protein
MRALGTARLRTHPAAAAAVATASSGSVGSNGSMVAGYRLETLLLAERDGLDSIFRRRCHRPGDLVVVHGRGGPVVGRGTA